MKTLMVIIPDRVSDLLDKGEYQPSYYNPGGLFDVVHIVTTAGGDAPDLEKLQWTVGSADLYFHSLSDDLSLVEKWPSCLKGVRLRRWARKGVDLARNINPDLMRCHGSDWNVFLAQRIKARLGVPYVVSLHINPDVNPTRRFLHDDLSPRQDRHNQFYEYIEQVGLQSANLVMPVYKPILPYLERLEVPNVEVCYNILNSKSLSRKVNYDIEGSVKLVYVGRLIEEKDPSNIIRAVANLPDAVFTIIGDGPIRPRLQELVTSLELSDRVIFSPSINNTELCHFLATQDIFTVHTEYFEISKSVLEALLTGLPVIINRREGRQVPELEGDYVLKVENTESSYFEALSLLIKDNSLRKSLGRRAFEYSQKKWAPSVTEAKYVEVYKRFINE